MMDEMPMGTQPQGGMGQGGGMQQGQPGQQGQMGGTMHDMMMGGMQQGQPGQMGGMGPQMGRGPMQPQGRMGQGGGMMLNDDMIGMHNMPGMAPGGADLTDRIEGRIAFLRTELGINDAQTAAWNQFAEALRGSRKHLLEARQALYAGVPAGDAPSRLEQYEHHIAGRLEAIKGARTAFAQLYAVLDDRQKEAADELLVPFIATF
jgi:hypothetical protein